MTATITRVRVERKGTRPPVWRERDLPLFTTHASLHDIMQVVLRWQDYHLHEFIAKDRVHGIPDADDVLDERGIYTENSMRLHIGDVICDVAQKPSEPITPAMHDRARQ